jgi:amino acid adenylation domain-containing protein
MSPEQQGLLSRRSGSETDYPRDRCVHQLFEERVEDRPGAVALIAEDQQLTYRELNSRANQLARYLHGFGVGPGTLVGICMERSAEMIVGLLGTLKAGAVYVPLDPGYPGERLALMIEDTRAGVILADTRSARRLPATAARVICLESDRREIAKEPDDDRDAGRVATDLAYVVYTSGSTGVPKGVEIRHRGVVRLVMGVDYVQLDHRQTILHLSPISFDAATFEVWAPLLHGGTCALYSGQAPTAKELGAALKRHRVTTLWLTAALFNAVIDEWPEALSEVRQLLIGGEALSVSHVRKGLAELPDTTIINGYGPTESTTFACCYRIPRRLDEHATSVPIGTPISNTHVYILDPQLQPVPSGARGELCIGGDGLARGYLNRPELTDAAFIRDPFSADPAGRLYRTGDHARYLPDGNIEFLGRIDRQVKLRGHRVELGEIEHALAQHPSIRQAVVLAREATPGDKELVAYAVVASGAHLSAPELRARLEQKLPEYMVPARFIFLDRMPLTPNGKLDLGALPAPDGSRPDVAEAYAGPRNELEHALAAMWAEVLKVDRVGINDNFFHLGGHSLRAARVLARVRETFQVAISVRELFDAPTVAGLADRIGQARGRADDVPQLPLRAVGREQPLPLSFAQEGLWFFDHLQPGSPVYIIRSVLRIAGTLNVEALQRSLQEIVNRHEALRTTFSAADGAAVQVIAPGMAMSLPVIDLAAMAEGAREEAARRIVEEEGRRSFDLTKGPLFRVQLVRLGREEHLLLLTVHHIVADGWSLEVLYEELSVLYGARVLGRPLPLPDLPLQYVDVAVCQRDWMRGSVLADQLAYWKEQLAEIASLELPTDRPRPAVQTYRGDSRSLELSETLTRELKALGQTRDVTLYMTLLAAFVALLRRYTGQTDVAVGSPIANRQRRAVERVIGFFVNTMVIRTDLSGDPTFSELLTRVREVALAAYAHQDVPFEKVVEALQPERDPSRAPLVQVFFNMLDFERLECRLEGLSVTRLPVRQTDSKFDLTVYVSETDGRIDLTVDYNADLFEPATTEAMLEHYRALLLGIVRAPDRPLSSHALLTTGSEPRAGRSDRANRPRNPFVEFTRAEIEEPIGARFQRQVRRCSTQLAVKTDRHEWSYGELNRRANAIAHALLEHRGGAGERVALLFEHDALMIAAILGALKSGQPYVPLDPANPDERLASVTALCQARVIIADAANAARARGLVDTAVRVIDVDAIDGTGPTDDPSLDVSPDALAYILYTSGSTGQPKGVMQSHRNVLHHIRAYTNALHIGSGDRLTLLASYGSDAAVMDIFAALLNGGTLCPVDVRAGDAASIASRMVERAVTVFHSTPTVYRHLFPHLPDGRRSAAMRLVVLGGEAVRRADVDLFRRHTAPDCIFVNGLGPTESTLALQYFISHRGDPARHIVPVGYPVADTEIVLLGDTGRDAELYGEIAIRSDHVALGYWGRPDLTAAAFVSGGPGDSRRLYRTGDMGRRLPDGSIAFCGRRDHQVKVRGFRVELGEIEAILRQHPGVREAVVVLGEEVAGERPLVAHVVAGSPGPSARELRAFARAKLPEYMVPRAYVVRGSLPLTRGGKIDRGALPGVPIDLGGLDEDGVRPRDGVEEMIHEVWSDVLGRRAIGVHDNFFDLGGHSLTAVVIVSQLRKIFPGKIPLHYLFGHPTIASLATRIREDQDAGHDASRPVSIGGGGDRPAADGGVDYAGARSEIEETLLRIWKAVLDRPQLVVRDNVVEAGSTFRAAEAARARMRDEFQIEVPMRSLFACSTIEGMAGVVTELARRKRDEAETRWQYLRRFQAGAGRPPLYIVPGDLAADVDNDSFLYARLAHYVGPEYPAYGLRPRGVDGTGAPHRNVEEMAQDYLTEIRSLQPEGPYFLIGACIGGVVAYEMACELERKGETVGFLGLLDTVYPSRYEYLKYRASLWTEPITGYSSYYSTRLGHHWNVLEGMQALERARYAGRLGRGVLASLGRRAETTLVSRMRRRVVPDSATPGAVDANDRARHAYGVVRQSYHEALKRHSPGRYRGRVVVISAAEVAEQFGAHAGWDAVAKGEIDAHVLAGTHFTLFRRDAKILGARLRVCLEGRPTPR